MMKSFPLFAIAVSASALSSAAYGEICKAGDPPPRAPAGRISESEATTAVSYVFTHAGYTGVTLYRRVNGKVRAESGAARPSPAEHAVGLIFPKYIQPDGKCYLPLDRMPAEGTLLELLEHMALHDATVAILRTMEGDALQFDIRGGRQLFPIPELYVENGTLKLRRKMSETVLGTILVSAGKSGS